MTRAERQEELEYLEGWYGRSKIALVVDYLGLNVEQITKLRKELRQSGAVGKVVKNTLATMAAGKSFSGGSEDQIAKLKKSLKGPSMLVISEKDPIAPAKVLTKFAKDNDKLKIKGAWFENAFVDLSGIQDLSKMPGREELLATLLALINTPATQLLRLMNAPAQQTVQVIEAQRKKLEEAGS